MVREHYDSWIPRLLGAGATTLMPFGIFYAYPIDRVPHSMRRHESQHVLQYRRMGWPVLRFFAFYATYLWQWASGGFKYLNISLEKEAYAHQNDADWPVTDLPPSP